MAEIDYQALQAELDAILESFNSGDQDIEAALKSYERASQIIGLLETYLVSAENTIGKIKANLKQAE